MSLDNDEGVKFKAESQIIVFFMCLRSWTWNAECNNTSITSCLIPSIVPFTRSFHLHFNHYVSRQDFRRPELRLITSIRVLGYRSGGPGSIPGTTRKKVVGLERGALSLVSTTEELLDRKVATLV
jgi:hypothetical protein